MKADSTWQFRNPVQIVFGTGCLSQLPKLVRDRQAMLVTTAGFTRRGLTDQIKTLLPNRLAQVDDTVTPNPDLATLERFRDSMPQPAPAVIVALGGGSVLDTAKVFSLTLAAGGSAFDLRAHLESGRPAPEFDPIPVLAIPTTAGTGSEVTPFATIWDLAAGKKFSLTSPKLFPETALLDPTLTLSCSRETTIASALDALSQALESIWNRNATPITSEISARAVSIVLRDLPRLTDRPDDVSLRAALMEASLLAGLAISNTRTALAHSMSYPITARFGVPHGLACSFTLPAVLEFNAPADDGRLQSLAARLGLPDCGALGPRLRQLFEQVDLNAWLAPYQLKQSGLIDLKHEMFTPGRADNNLRAATTEDVERMLRRACETFPSIHP